MAYPYPSQPAYPAYPYPPPTAQSYPAYPQTFLTPAQIFHRDLPALNVNSRPIITHLTTQAVQTRNSGDWEGMALIARELEGQIDRADADKKLPVFYLLDSIAKNIGPPFSTTYFPPFLPRCFLRAYAQVDGVTKTKMEEMVATWKQGGPNGGDVFGGGAREEIERAIYGAAGGPMEGPSREMVMKQLNGTLAWKKHVLGLNPHDAEARLHVGVLEQISNMLNTQRLTQDDLKQIQTQLVTLNADRQQAPIPTQLQPQIDALSRGLYGQPTPSSVKASEPQGTSTKMDFGDLFRNLAAAGVISSTPPPPPFGTADGGTPDMRLMREGSVGSVGSAASAVAPFTVNARADNVPAESDNDMEAYEELILGMNVKLVLDDLQKERSFNPVAHLPNRCSQCSARFATGKSGQDRLRAHMDWHFRRNRKERESEGREGNRRWLPRAESWITDVVATSSTAPGEATGSSSGLGTKVTPAVKAERRAALLKKWIPVPSDPAEAATPCPICKEAFQSEFAEDEEEWVWRNAVKVDNQIFHATCRADAMSSAVANRLLVSEASKAKAVNRDKSPGRTSRATTPQKTLVGSIPPPASPLKASVVTVKQEPSDPVAAVESTLADGSPPTLKRKADEGSPPVDAEQDVKKEKLD